jgi:hypothetical protein
MVGAPLLLGSHRSSGKHVPPSPPPIHPTGRRAAPCPHTLRSKQCKLEEDSAASAASGPEGCVRGLVAAGEEPGVSQESSSRPRLGAPGPSLLYSFCGERHRSGGGGPTPELMPRTHAAMTMPPCAMQWAAAVCMRLEGGASPCMQRRTKGSGHRTAAMLAASAQLHGVPPSGSWRRCAHGVLPLCIAS